MVAKFVVDGVGVAGNVVGLVDDEVVVVDSRVVVGEVVGR